MEKTERDIIAEWFAGEWTLVTENEAGLSGELYESAKEALESETPVAVLGDKLKDEWETLAEQVKDLVSERLGEIAGLYIGQILQGWGSYPFDIIARRAIEQVKETESLLKTGN